MPNAAVRATATAKPKSTKSTPAGLARLYRPGVRERGLKILAKAQDDAAVIKKEAPAPEASPQDDYVPALAAKIIADARYDIAAEKRKAKAEAEAAAKAEAPKLEASQAFAEAYYAWLAAKAGDENPSVEDEEAERFSFALPVAERRLMLTPPAYPDQLWQKLEAFESILGDEIMSGPRRDSVIMLALASIKQDIVNLGLLEAIR
jgi:hypothetical protein